METYPSFKNIVLKALIFFISTVFIAFEIYEEIISYKDQHFLHENNDMRTAWEIFGTIGFFLSVLQLLVSFVGLLLAVCKWCCCTRKQHNEYELVAVDEGGLAKSDRRHSRRQPENCLMGWNDSTRNDFMGSLIIWFQDIPFLIIYVIGLYSNSKTSESSDFYKSTDLSTSTIPQRQYFFLLPFVLFWPWYGDFF